MPGYLVILALRAWRGMTIVRARLAGMAVLPALLGSLCFVLVFFFCSPQGGVEGPLSKAVYAEGGELLTALTASDGQWRMQLSVTELPPKYVKALVLFEDRRFWGHCGFDPWAILRALKGNLEKGSIASGASTLSMQMARLSSPGNRRTLWNKIMETWVAVRYEATHTKKEVLYHYSELAPFGANVVGVEAAGFRWFGRSPAETSWGEAAILAVLPNNPGAVHPGRSRDELKNRRDALLRRLHSAGMIDSMELEVSLKEELPEKPKPMPDMAMHLCLKADEGRTVTSLDYNLQLMVDSIVQNHAINLARKKINNMAAVVLRVEDGSVAAWVGNVAIPGVDNSWHVDCVTAPRSSGSILKPFLYTLMLSSGELGPKRLLPDIPTRIGSYSPENNLRNYSGAVAADEALARSLNIPFVRLLQSYGVERFLDRLKNLGFASTLWRSSSDYGLTLILGGAEARLVDAAAAYAALARNALGMKIEPQWSWNKDDGQSLQEGVKAGSKYAGISQGAAWLGMDALLRVERPGEDAFWQSYASSYQLAWKTGTSYGNRDAFAIGINSSYVVAVWAGNASGEGRPELKGTEIAAPVMFEIFSLLPRDAWFPKPADALKFVTVCAQSGYIAGPDCAGTARIEIPVEAMMDQVCPYCQPVFLTLDGTRRLNAECAGSEEIRVEKRFVLPPAMEWYYRNNHLDYRGLPPWKEGCTPSSEQPFAFISPDDGAEIYIPVELDGSPGRAVFRIISNNPSARLFWHLDDDYIGSTIVDHNISVRPAPGRHQLVVTDSNGFSQRRNFTVLE